ncbi:MAG: hypothetical protein IT349_19265 [Candidatus Eisenbacteria bacterium]|nr:hypothetical protein [Candidatus Eisenbacteria bacterium]
MICELTRDGARALSPYLRELDTTLMEALSYHDDVAYYCESRIEIPGPKWMMVHERPEAMGGLQVTCPGTLTGWVVASRGWEAHKLEAIRYMKRVIDYAIVSGMANRVQAWVLAESAMANRMAATVGLSFEARIAKLANGRDVNIWARVK